MKNPGTKTPKLFRPLLTLGIIVLSLAIFSWLLVPSWRSSPTTTGVLLFAIIIGVAAIVRDLGAFNKEYKRMQEHDRGDKSGDR